MLPLHISVLCRSPCRDTRRFTLSLADFTDFCYPEECYWVGGHGHRYYKVEAIAIVVLFVFTMTVLKAPLPCFAVTPADNLLAGRRKDSLERSF